MYVCVCVCVCVCMCVYVCVHGGIPLAPPFVSNLLHLATCIHSIVITVTKKTEEFNNGTQPLHVVNRERLFDDAINLYKKKFVQILKHYPFSIEYENEMAHDTGGVSRDMFSQFWSEACLKCFDGGNLLVPAINPHMDVSVFSVTILSHGFLVSTFLPLRIAFPSPSLAAMLLGPTVLIPNSILIDAFADYLSTNENAFIRVTTTCFY